MSLAAIEKLLQETMGLNAASIGSSAITRAVQQRMRERHIQTPEEYLQRLRGSSVELQQLIDQVIIPETWFFRDQQPFVALAQHAQAWKYAGHPAPLRILSVPCSTGEEPYSIVMALLDAGLKPTDFQVDGVDICESNLHRARAGLYREHSFRGSDNGIRERYFLRSEQGFLLNPEVRKQVQFRHANLLDAGFGADYPLYDVVFCRNLLIYFDRATQSRALQILQRLLHPKGLLFLGHAEAGVIAGSDFSPLEHPCSFAFLRGRKQADEQAHGRSQRRRPRLATKSLPEKARPFAAVMPAPNTPAAPDTEARGVLDTATRLADEGHMAEAATVCEAYLNKHGPDAQAFYLLAIVREAVGEPAEAEALLRKALYLDPAHYEALTQLALLLEQRGDSGNADIVRQRALRCHNRRQSEAASRAEQP